MSKLHHIIYLPGLGDDRFGPSQTWLLKLWRIYGLKVHYQYIGWADGEPFEPKLERILTSIDKHAEHGVSLIGTSAGASAAINAYAARREIIKSVVCICGKLRNPQTILPERLEQNPAFKDSLELLEQSLSALKSSERHKIYSARPLKDNIVPPDDTQIQGAHSLTLPTVGHGLSILYALTLGSWRLSRIIKFGLS